MSSTTTDLSGVIFGLITPATPLLDVNYTPTWGRGTPSVYIDNVTFPKPLTTKSFEYRVVENGNDLGVHGGFAIEANGSQRVNFLQFNGGYGISDTHTIRVYVVDPDSGNQYLVANWTGN